MAKEYKDLVVGLDIGTAKVMAVVAEVMAVDGTFYRIKAETLFEVHRSKVLPGGADGAPQRQSEIKFIVGTVDVDTGEGSRSIVRTDAATADIASRSAVASAVASGSPGVKRTRAASGAGPSSRKAPAITVSRAKAVPSRCRAKPSLWRLAT